MRSICAGVLVVRAGEDNKDYCLARAQQQSAVVAAGQSLTTWGRITFRAAGGHVAQNLDSSGNASFL
jgi:hypothetical protein